MAKYQSWPKTNKKSQVFACVMVSEQNIKTIIEILYPFFSPNTAKQYNNENPRRLRATIHENLLEEPCILRLKKIEIIKILISQNVKTNTLGMKKLKYKKSAKQKFLEFTVKYVHT